MSATDTVSWLFVLAGDPSDLSVLCACTRGQSGRIVARADGYVLSMPALPGDRDYIALYLVAWEQLEILNGIGHLLQVEFLSVALRSQLFGVNEEGERCTEDIAVYGPEGEIRQGLTDSEQLELAASELFRAIASSGEACRALAVVSADAPTWSQLYLAYEMAVHGTHGALGEICSVTKEEIVRFSRTANSFQTLGPLGRHGHARTEPPTDPMEYREALSFVRRVISAWLRHEACLTSDVDAQA